MVEVVSDANVTGWAEVGAGEPVSGKGDVSLVAVISSIGLPEKKKTIRSQFGPHVRDDVFSVYADICGQRCQISLCIRAV